MRLPGLQKAWNEAGKTDPYWAVLSDPQKKGNRWQIDEFFQTGISEIDALMRHLEALDLEIAHRRALDFGCGPGRLSQALARYFEQVDGVDISPSMIAHAKSYNRFGDRCKYTLNEKLDLRMFDDGAFDFIYSNITLQHMPPRYSRRYIAEFLRVLAPGGALLFQLTSRSTKVESIMLAGVRKFYYRVLWDFIQPETPLMDMYAVPKDKVVRLITENGGQVLDIVDDPAAAPDWEGFRYLVVRAP